MPKAYLGDGVYVDYDGFNLILTTENGIEVQNTIVLEPDVYAAFLVYVIHLVDGQSNKTPNQTN